MKRIITIIALAAAAAAHAQAFNGLQLVPVIASVRTDATIDMLWQITDASDGSSWEQRLAVTGCAEGRGELYLVEDDYSLTTPEGVPWVRGGGISGSIAQTMCNAAGV